MPDLEVEEKVTRGWGKPMITHQRRHIIALPHELWAELTSMSIILNMWITTNNNDTNTSTACAWPCIHSWENKLSRSIATLGKDTFAFASCQPLSAITQDIDVFEGWKFGELCKRSEWRKALCFARKIELWAPSKVQPKNSKSRKTLKSVHSYQKLGVTFKTSPNLSHVVYR